MDRRAALQLITAGLLAATANAQAETWDDVVKNKVMRVAVMQDFPPFGSVGTDMQPRGFDIDVAYLLAKKLNVQIVFVPVSGANRIPFLQTRKVDLIIACLGRNAEREKVIDYGPAYTATYNAIWGPKELRVTQALDLAGKSIAVPRGSTEDADLTKIAPPTASIRRFEDSNGSMSAYLAGQVDLFVTGNTLIPTLKARYPDRSIEAKMRFTDEKVYIGYSKGEGRLKTEVDAAIAEFKRDGSLSALSQKWFGTPLADGI